jgi:hypothetical protein
MGRIDTMGRLKSDSAQGVKETSERTRLNQTREFSKVCRATILKESDRNDERIA